MSIRADIAEVMRTHGTPLGLGDEVPGDEYDCCAAEVMRAVLSHLREWTDDIAGSRLDRPDGKRVWLHTQDQIDAWLARILATPGSAGDTTGGRT